MANNDLISRSALIAYVKELPTYDPTDKGFIFKRYPSGLFAPDDIVKSIQNAPAVDAVPVERLGRIGKLFLPYKGCSRGHVGRMGAPATLEEEALFWGVITDVDGWRWVPVVEAVLMELIEKAKANDPESLRPKGRWIVIDDDYEWDDEADDECYVVLECECSVCGERTKKDRPNYCDNCGAKMEG